MDEDKEIYHIHLILAEIYARKKIRDENLLMLENDILRVQNMFNDIPFPLNYARDREWQDRNKLVLSLHEQIRAEQLGLFKDTEQLRKELRESRLELWVQKKESVLFEDDGGNESINDNDSIDILVGGP